jgi:hypothetical protein
LSLMRCKLERGQLQLLDRIVAIDGKQVCKNVVISTNTKAPESYVR